MLQGEGCVGACLDRGFIQGVHSLCLSQCPLHMASACLRTVSAFARAMPRLPMTAAPWGWLTGSSRVSYHKAFRGPLIQMSTFSSGLQGSVIIVSKSGACQERHGAPQTRQGYSLVGHSCMEPLHCDANVIDCVQRDKSLWWREYLPL